MWPQKYWGRTFKDYVYQANQCWNVAVKCVNCISNIVWDFLWTMRKTLWFFSTGNQSVDSFRVHSRLSTEITEALAYATQIIDMGLSPQIHSNCFTPLNNINQKTNFLKFLLKTFWLDDIGSGTQARWSSPNMKSIHWVCHELPQFNSIVQPSK